MRVKFLNPGDPFPPPEETDSSGLIAVGGTLSESTLQSAYSRGIFPWYSEGEPIMWWNPDPRMVLFPKELHISSSMKKILNSERFKVTVNRDFERVINSCRSSGSRENGTWITDEMVEAYIGFHRRGYAHSVEVWENDILAGGLYGVALGKVFFGESMFYFVKNASKFGFIRFVKLLEKMGFIMIDCQIYTDHLATMGAREISGKIFREKLKKHIGEPGNRKVLFPEVI